MGTEAKFLELKSKSRKQAANMAVQLARIRRKLNRLKQRRLIEVEKLVVEKARERKALSRLAHVKTAMIIQAKVTHLHNIVNKLERSHIKELQELRLKENQVVGTSRTIGLKRHLMMIEVTKQKNVEKRLRKISLFLKRQEARTHKVNPQGRMEMHLTRIIRSTVRLKHRLLKQLKTLKSKVSDAMNSYSAEKQNVSKKERELLVSEAFLKRQAQVEKQAVGHAEEMVRKEKAREREAEEVEHVKRKELAAALGKIVRLHRQLRNLLQVRVGIVEKLKEQRAKVVEAEKRKRLGEAATKKSMEVSRMVAMRLREKTRMLRHLGERVVRELAKQRMVVKKLARMMEKEEHKVAHAKQVEALLYRKFRRFLKLKKRLSETLHVGGVKAMRSARLLSAEKTSLVREDHRLAELNKQQHNAHNEVELEEEKVRREKAKLRRLSKIGIYRKRKLESTKAEESNLQKDVIRLRRSK